jgi:predicted glycosyltransferase
MRIIFDVGHPGHVHLFKNVIWQLERRGHKILITAREKDLTIPLLDAYGFKYEHLSKAGKGVLGLLAELIWRDWRLLGIARRFQPNILVGIGDAMTRVGRIIGKPSIALTDTEHAAIVDRFLTYPFATVICTPECFKRDLGKRHVRYDGYHELAYLHPNYFQPDPHVLDELGISVEEPFMVLRFVAWQASHDIGHKGFSYAGKLELVKKLAQLGRVIITSEAPLPSEFEPFSLSISPTKLHDLLYYSSLYIGEGGTMASEAAVLGVPSIYVNPLTLGYLEEQEQEYGLVYRITDEQEAIELAVQLGGNRNVSVEHQQKRQRMLADKIDVTAFIGNIVEGYAS